MHIQPSFPSSSQTYVVTLHEVQKLPANVNETYSCCLRGGWIIIIIDPLGCSLSLCHSWLAVLGKSYYICRILKAKGESEKKKRKEAILNIRFPAVLWFRSDSGEKVEFIVWQRENVGIREKKIIQILMNGG